MSENFLLAERVMSHVLHSDHGQDMGASEVRGHLRALFGDNIATLLKSKYTPGNQLSASNPPTVGMAVVDDEGTEGTVTEADDLYNILVVYPEWGQGLYCMVDGCPECTDTKLRLYRKETDPA